MAKNDIYVSPGGNDAGPGTESEPLGTIRKAAEKIRPGQVCRVGPGRYREIVTLTQSGTEKDPARFVAEPGAIIDGTEPITGEWEAHEGKIWKMTVHRELEQLFVDGRMMIEARWPNIRFKDILGSKGWAPTGTGSRYGKIVDPNLAKTGVDWTGAHATLNVAHQFYSWNRRVSTHEAGGDTLTYPQNLPGITHYADKTTPWEDNRYYLFGALGALDSPGEWFLDTETKTLYLWTLEGDCPAGHDVTGKARDYGISAENLEHVCLEGFEFFACSFRFENCSHIVVDGCHLLFPTYSRDLTELGDPRRPSPATLISGERNMIRNSSLAFSNTHGFVMRGSHNVIENSLVHDVCWNGSLSYVGIMVGDRPGRAKDEEGGCVVRRNTVFNCGNTCVHVGNMPANIAEYNHIYDGGKACKDVSLLYTHLPVIEGTVFRYNWVHGCHTPHIALGIRGDDQTRGLTVHHNVVWDCAWAGIVVKGDRNKVCNNTVLGSGKSDIILRDQPEPEKPWRKQWPLLEVQNENTEAYNNCAGTATSGLWDGPPLKCRQGNNYWGGQPRLADPGNCDFRPGQGSPLVNAGREIPGITDGFNGEAPDIGAYESGGEKWVPGVTWDEAEFEKRLYRELRW